MKNVLLQVQVPTVLKAKVKKCAKAEGLKMAAYVRNLLIHAMADK